MDVFEEVDQGILQTENVRQLSDVLDVLKLEEKIQRDSRDGDPVWLCGVFWRRTLSWMLQRNTGGEEKLPQCPTGTS